MPLTDASIRNAKPGDKPRSVSDGRGLSLFIQPAGGKWWRFRYRFEGRVENRLSPALPHQTVHAVLPHQMWCTTFDAICGVVQYVALPSAA